MNSKSKLTENSRTENRIKNFDKLDPEKREADYIVPYMVSRKSWNSYSDNKKREIERQGLKPVFISRVVIHGRNQVSATVTEHSKQKTLNEGSSN